MTSRPDVRVQSVSDPDGNGADFAYTVGLAACGLPELHLWARPSEGADPAADWMLSNRDRGWILDEFTDQLLRGQLAVGDEIVKLMDEGLTEVRFRVGPPVDPAEVEAYGVDAGAKVLPLRWSLHRPPEGPLTPADPDLTRLLEPCIARVWQHLQCAQHPLSPPEPPSFARQQPYGPMTPWVDVNIDRFSEMPAHIFRTFCDNLFAVEVAGHCIRSYDAVLAAVARRAGRTFALEALADPVGQIIDVWSERLVSDRAWQWTFDRFLDDFDCSGETERAAFTQEMLHHWARDAVRGHLGACVVWDLLTPDLRRRAYGPLAFSYGEQTDAPELWPLTDWQAPREIQARIRDLLSGFELDDLRAVGGLYLFGQTSIQQFAELDTKLLGWRLTGAATLDYSGSILARVAPEAYELLCVISSDPYDDNLIGVTEDAEELAAAIMRPLNALGSAMVHRDRLTGTELQFAIDTFRQIVPGSDELLLGLETAL